MKLTNFNFTVKQMSLKLLAITSLTLLMLIPKFMITDLVNERARLNDDVNEEVATSWAKDQLITGPYLSIPYFKEVLNEKKEIVKEKQLFTLLPNTTKINGTLQTDERNRSIYNVLLYETDLLFNSSFSLQDFNSLKIKPEFIVWKEAFVSLNISDPKGIKKEVLLECNNNKLKMNPGLNDLHITANKEYSEKAIDKIKNRIFKTNDPSNTGLHTIIPLDSQIQEINISIPLSLKGSRGLLFTPTAKNLSLKYSSTFTDPSFIGEYLPDRNITDSGFTAEWNILEYNKEIPNYFNETHLIKVGNSIFGMNIQNPVNHYSKTDRACKYLILFILVIFLSLFLTEIYYRIKVHLFQYGLIGFALAIFFALLLSISEFINFNSAYAISFISVTTLIFLYSKSIFSNKSSVYLLSSLVIMFFSFIFIIIQLEKTALLFGTIMLFSILTATMYVTTNIKWNEEKNETQNNNELTEEKILY